MGEMKGIMFLEINVLVNYEDRRYSDKKKDCGALLTVLKKICKTEDFWGKILS